MTEIDKAVLAQIALIVVMAGIAFLAEWIAEAMQ
jgi:hypothetical protein